MNEKKPWYKSMTIWGSIVTMLALVLQMNGKHLPEDFQKVVSEGMLNLSTVVAEVLGAFMIIYGRLRAKKAIGKA